MNTIGFLVSILCFTAMFMWFLKQKYVEFVWWEALLALLIGIMSVITMISVIMVDRMEMYL